MKVSMDKIKELREKTGCGVMDAKKALEESEADLKKAEAWIMKKGVAKAEKKSDRETKQGVVMSYIHHDGKAGALVKLLCETDFVAKTEDFKKLAYELAMQVTSMQPKDNEEFLKQDYVRDSSLTIEALIKQTAAKLGENVQLGEFVRLSL